MGVKIRSLILILLAAEGVAVLFKLIRVQHEGNVSSSHKATKEAFHNFTQRHRHSNISIAEWNTANAHIIQSMNDYMYSVDCKALISGSEYELKKAKPLVEETAKINEETQENILIRKTTECDRYVKNSGYIISGMAEKEVNFPIAYSIITHTDALQTERLLRAIYRPQNVYCIHVDANSSIQYFNAIDSVANCFSNVFLSDERIYVKWGKISVLEVELICMKELLERNKFWKYFINLTGQEFPLKTNAELVDILTAFNGANSVNSVKHSRQFSRRFQDAGKAPMTPYKGHLHIVVNREFVQFAVHDARARKLFDWANNTRIPDEIFFSTLNRNPTLQIPGSYKYKDLKAPSDPFVNRLKLRHVPCKGTRLRGVCLLGIDYLPELSNSARLFANKFVWGYDNLSLHCLHQLLNNRTRDVHMGLSSFDATWYSTLDFVVNKL